MNSKKVLALGMAAVMAAGMTGCSVPGRRRKHNRRKQHRHDSGGCS